MCAWCYVKGFMARERKISSAPCFDTSPPWSTRPVECITKVDGRRIGMLLLIGTVTGTGCPLMGRWTVSRKATMPDTIEYGSSDPESSCWLGRNIIISAVRDLRLCSNRIVRNTDLVAPKVRQQVRAWRPCHGELEVNLSMVLTLWLMRIA